MADVFNDPGNHEPTLTNDLRSMRNGGRISLLSLTNI
jgi:hypothetical protein